ncbi:MAG: response regulator [Oscillospiraceae bacterium]|nr:response regulator [Oscillospiraceae bacterium]
MSKKITFFNRINVRILIMLLILFAGTTLILSMVNQNNIRRLYEENFTERVLLTNALMATIIDSEDVEYFVDLMINRDAEFKQRQIRFYHDREELWRLQEEDASEEEQKELLESLAAFHSEMAVFKTESYRHTLDEIKLLKEVSHSTYLYVLADTGLVTEEGEILYTYIFDAEDDEVYSDPDMDGLGTCNVGEDYIKSMYELKRQMDRVEYYSGDYGELYYAYAPILNEDGEVIAVLGTDLELGNMNSAIAASSLLFNMVSLAFFIVIFLFIFIFLRHSITKPLGSLTNTARELAGGNVYSPTAETVLKQRGEIGMLAGAISDMSLTYQEMISSTGKLFDAANIGKLDIRNDAADFKGDIQNVMKKINGALDATTLYLNSLPESVVIMSKKPDIYFRNDQFANYFGDIRATEFLSKVLPQNTQSDSEPSKAVNFGEELIGEALSPENKNTIVWIDGRCFSIIFKEIDLPNENENSILVIAVDITDLMNEKEKAQTAAKAKSDFLSHMSHEMRTPMNAIIGMAKIAGSTEDVSKLKYCLAAINTSSEHLLGIINDVLDMSKIEAGKFELENVPMNIEKMLIKVCNIIIENMEKKNQTFNVTLDKKLSFHYIADDLRLSQVITNLLSNATKFTPEGGKITLAVEKTGESEAGCTLRFSVSDTGIGMTEEQISRLFNAFEQADGGTTRKFGGTGLGLTISKNIIEMMNGRIWTESKPGIGSSFIFEVTLDRSPHRDTAVIDSILPKDIKLLVIESDDDVKSRFSDITESFGIGADFASNIDETLSLIETAVSAGRAYDIVFLDYDMPGTNGIDFINQIGSIDKNTVILVTTHLEWNRIKKIAFDNNITRFITKPVFPSSVSDAINDITGNTRRSSCAGADAAPEVPDLSGICIILAEDVEINREIFLALLEETHISIDCAENGLAAVKRFKENPDKYDLIIMDVQMPEMDGHQATGTIRSLDIPKAKTIPIIAMTANAFKEDIEKCLLSGMNDHLAKPIDEKSVIEKIIHYSKNKTASSGRNPE